LKNEKRKTMAVHKISPCPDFKAIPTWKEADALVLVELKRAGRF
jgi:hypothetical protein